MIRAYISTHCNADEEQVYNVEIIEDHTFQIRFKVKLKLVSIEKKQFPIEQMFSLILDTFTKIMTYIL